MYVTICYIHAHVCGSTLTDQADIAILLSVCSALFSGSIDAPLALVFPRRQWNDGGRPCHS